MVLKSSIVEQKKHQRVESFTIRNRCHSAEKEHAAGIKLYQFFSQFKPPLIISGYNPIKNEINPFEVLEKLEHDGFTICLPVVKARNAPLQFKSWTFGSELVKGDYHVGIPKTGKWVLPDIMIVPLLAFDKFGYRLGYGGGYYDRTFAVMNENRKRLKVGFAYSEQELESVPRDEKDIPLDMIITQNEQILVN